MTGRPGAGCEDPRDVHSHWCGTCGAKLAFTREECAQLRIVPSCPRCGGTDWRDEIDELTSPDIRELPTP